MRANIQVSMETDGPELVDANASASDVDDDERDEEGTKRSTAKHVSIRAFGSGRK